MLILRPGQADDAQWTGAEDKYFTYKRSCSQEIGRGSADHLRPPPAAERFTLRADFSHTRCRASSDRISAGACKPRSLRSQCSLLTRDRGMLTYITAVSDATRKRKFCSISSLRVQTAKYLFTTQRFRLYVRFSSRLSASGEISSRPH